MSLTQKPKISSLVSQLQSAKFISVLSSYTSLKLCSFFTFLISYKVLPKFTLISEIISFIDSLYQKYPLFLVKLSVIHLI